MKQHVAMVTFPQSSKHVHIFWTIFWKPEICAIHLKFSNIHTNSKASKRSIGTVTSCVCKTMEMIVIDDLIWFLESNISTLHSVWYHYFILNIYNVLPTSAEQFYGLFSFSWSLTKSINYFRCSCLIDAKCKICLSYRLWFAVLFRYNVTF